MVICTTPNRINAPAPVRSRRYASENAIAYANSAPAEIQFPLAPGDREPRSRIRIASVIAPETIRTVVNVAASMSVPELRAIRQRTEFAAKPVRAASVRATVDARVDTAHIVQGPRGVP